MDALSVSKREIIKEGLTSKYLFLQDGDRSMTLSSSLQRVKKQVSIAAKSCHKTDSFNVTVDDSFTVKVGGYLQLGMQYFQAMQLLCEEDIDYQEEIRKIEGLVFSFSDKTRPFSLNLKGGVLSVEIAEHQENTVLFAKKWLEENL